MPKDASASLRLPSNVWLVGQESAASQRRGRYAPESVRCHPTKTLPALARRMVEAFTSPGETILDPMSGICTIGVEAVHLGRSYVGVELEERFVKLQLASLEQAKQEGAPGEFALLHGNARDMDPDFCGRNKGLLQGFAPFDAILFSPPYGGRGEPPRRHPPRSLLRLIAAGKLGATAVPMAHELSVENLGNLKDDHAYFAGMRHVYAGCYALLKPGGLTAVCCRAARTGSHLRPLHHETARLCQDIGFTYLDEIVAVLGRVALTGREGEVVPHASFGQRRSIAHLRASHLPVSLNQVEFVLLFQKPPLPTSRDKGPVIPKERAARKPPG